MKKGIWKMVPVLLAALLSLSLLFTGCQPGVAVPEEIETPDKALSAVLAAWKQGDAEEILELIGGGTTSSASEQVAEYGEALKLLFPVLLQHLDVTVDLAQGGNTNSEATVWVVGKNADLRGISDLDKTGMEAAFAQWAEENADKLDSLSDRELGMEAIRILAKEMDAQIKQFPTQNVNVPIRMVRNRNGFWDVNAKSRDMLAYVLFGTSEMEIQDVLSNIFS